MKGNFDWIYRMQVFKTFLELHSWNCTFWQLKHIYLNIKVQHVNGSFPLSLFKMWFLLNFSLISLVILILGQNLHNSNDIPSVACSMEFNSTWSKTNQVFLPSTFDSNTPKPSSHCAFVLFPRPLLPQAPICHFSSSQPTNTAIRGRFPQESMWTLRGRQER